MQGLDNEAVSEGRETVEETTANIMGQVHHLAPDFDWSQLAPISIIIRSRAVFVTSS